MDSKSQLMSAASDRVVESRSTACVPLSLVMYSAVVLCCAKDNVFLLNSV